MTDREDRLQVSGILYIVHSSIYKMAKNLEKPYITCLLKPILQLIPGIIISENPISVTKKRQHLHDLFFEYFAMIVRYQSI